MSGSDNDKPAELGKVFSDFSINSSNNSSNKSKSISNTDELNVKYDYSKNPDLYKKELYKLIEKKLKGMPDTVVKKEYEERLRKLKSKK